MVQRVQGGGRVEVLPRGGEVLPLGGELLWQRL